MIIRIFKIDLLMAIGAIFFINLMVTHILLIFKLGQLFSLCSLYYTYLHNLQTSNKTVYINRLIRSPREIPNITIRDNIVNHIKLNTICPTLFLKLITGFKKLFTPKPKFISSESP